MTVHLVTPQVFKHANLRSPVPICGCRNIKSITKLVRSTTCKRCLASVAPRRRRVR